VANSEPSAEVGQSDTDPRPAAVSFVTTEHFALPTSAFLGLVSFDRVLQSGIEDYGYAHRIARLRGYYFQNAPELVDHLLSVTPAQRLRIQGLQGGHWQRFLTVAGMVSVITAVLAGSAAGLLAAAVFDHLLVPALIAGILVAVAVLVWLIRSQAGAGDRVSATPLFTDEEPTPR
jgi:hypothetical protein